MAVETLAPRAVEHAGLPGEVILPPWVAEPYRLWSLLEMLEFNYSKFTYDLFWFDDQIKKLDEKYSAGLPVTGGEREVIARKLMDIYLHREGLGIIHEAASHYWLNHTARVGASFSTSHSIALALGDLRSELIQTLSGLTFAFIPRAEYFEKEELFGQEVKNSFPSASIDIREAGNCFAAGVFTASVFHLMRAVEHLLRAFVVAVGVRPTGRSLPLEHMQWQNLIEAAESKVNRKLNSTWNSQVRKSVAQDVLRSSVADFYSFKDNVRNHISHTRSGALDEAAALSIMNRVKACFVRLAPYIAEDKNRSLLNEARWTKRRRT